MGESLLQESQRLVFHCVDINQGEKNLNILSFSQSDKGRQILRFILELREKAARQTPSGSVKF